MEHPLSQADVKAAFVGAAYYKIHPILISYTAEFENGKLFAKIVILHSATEAETDDTMDILGGIVGEFGTLTADCEIIRVSTLQDGEDIAPLQIKLFHRAL